MLFFCLGASLICKKSYLLDKAAAFLQQEKGMDLSEHIIAVGYRVNSYEATQFRIIPEDSGQDITLRFR